MQILRPSSLHNGISYAGKTTYSYWHQNTDAEFNVWIIVGLQKRYKKSNKMVPIYHIGVLVQQGQFSLKYLQKTFFTSSLIKK